MVRPFHTRICGFRFCLKIKKPDQLGLYLDLIDKTKKSKPNRRPKFLFNTNCCER